MVRHRFGLWSTKRSRVATGFSYIYRRHVPKVWGNSAFRCSKRLLDLSSILLSNTLQVDIAFAPQEHFGARAPTFKLVFGESGGATQVKPTNFEVYAGWCWLYALHIRSSIKRGKVWQAEYFVGAMRNHLISLVCRRYKLPEKEGRGVDGLPREELLNLEPTLIKSVDLSELQRAFGELTKLYLNEVGRIDKGLRQSIEPVLIELYTN